MYAPTIGMIGVAAELAINGCVYQVYGKRGLENENGAFKSASAIIDDFITILKTPSSRLSFLLQGISDEPAHLYNLINKAKQFRTLAKSRAGGLHAGIGPSRDIALMMAKEVSDFLTLLAYAPYF
jgi:hypothetical protein